jgi:4-hydroxyphenylpyruvate dioxygenase
MSNIKTWDNPMQTDGFDFVEFAAPNPAILADLFIKQGFVAVSKHKTKKITRYQQGGINFLLNEEPEGFAKNFSAIHGPAACGMGFRVKDAAFAHKRALSLGAKDFGPHGDTLDLAAIYGIGDSALYLVDQYGSSDFYASAFTPIPGATSAPTGCGLNLIDHLTHNVNQGNMDKWAQFYETLFNFKEIRYFDIEGKLTGLVSRALTSPCGKIRIPINESKDDHSQIEEYLKAYNGEGIQHIAMYTNNIYETVEGLSKKGLKFLDVPDTYYDQVNKRVPEHGEDLDRMRKNKILIDGNYQTKEGILLQLFTENVIGPIFFEIIQRKGNEGFGEGNFKALFVAMEQDQIRRGVLEDK